VEAKHVSGGTIERSNGTMNTAPAEARSGSTPILDGLAPLPEPVKPVSASRSLLVSLIGAGLMVLIIAVLRVWKPQSLGAFREWLLSHKAILFPGEWTPLRGITVIVEFFLAVLLAVTVHELGHALGGLCAGFRFSQLRIGPLQIDRPCRISFQRNSGTGYAGWVSMFPVRRDHLLARAMLLVFAGPAMNFLCAGILLVLPFLMGFFWWTFLVVSVVLGVRELLPIRRRVAVSDGRRLWLLLRSPQWSRRWLALLRLSAELREGVLPEALSAEFLADAVAYRDDAPDTVTAHALAYAAAYHQRRDVEAGQHLETCLRYSSWAPPAQREALMSDAAVFQARRRRRADLAQMWLDLLPQRPRLPWLRTRAEAGILEARGDIAGALGKLQELEAGIGSIPDHAQQTMLRRLVERWRDDLRGGTA
jgi:hypothetical protein